MKTFIKHMPHYVVLFGLLLAGFGGMILFSYDRGFQTAVAFATASSYVAWGIVHHAVHGDLHLETIVEYILISTVGLTIILTLVLGAF